MAEIISGGPITSENESTKTEAKGIELVTNHVVEEFLKINDEIEFDLSQKNDVADEEACWVNFGVGGPA
jgi:hypothetical protein